ncbi:MAG: cytochrome c-type biogenesis protein CcmH [Arenimonas sp.]|nr:cytochrome c-type biogenesis protein CcmH [Arenimonas sp.]MBP7916995.1 cytochrome c-type biogenesis protein CcmH [Arenimonas sp.]
MSRVWPALALAFSLLFAGYSYGLEPVDYRSDSEEQRFKALTAELRCVMCQNQSIADSNAPIAHDLRVEVLRLMREGRSDAQIKQYLVERYTDFVLYEPPMKKSTWLLWAGPFLLLLIGAGAVIMVIRRKNATPAVSPEESEEW